MMAEEDISFTMAEGEMDVKLPLLGTLHTKGFRLYSLILLALMGFLAAALMNNPRIAEIQTVVVFLLGVFTGKKA